MENIDEEEIQRFIEERFKSQQPVNSQSRNDGAFLYEVLFSELTQFPVASQNHLADKIVLLLEKECEKKDKLYNILAIAALSISFAALVLIALINSPILMQIGRFMHIHLSAFLYVLVMFSIIQTADKFISSRKNLISTPLYERDEQDRL